MNGELGLVKLENPLMCDCCRFNRISALGEFSEFALGNVRVCERADCDNWTQEYTPLVVMLATSVAARMIDSEVWEQ